VNETAKMAKNNRWQAFSMKKSERKYQLNNNMYQHIGENNNVAGE